MTKDILTPEEKKRVHDLYLLEKLLRPRLTIEKYVNELLERVIERMMTETTGG